MNLQPWQIALGVLGLLIGFGSLLTPVVLAAIARDRSLIAMIGAVKEDAARATTAATEPIHERINRVRDEFVRRDDLESHLARIDKQFGELREDFRRGTDEIKTLIRSGRQ